MVVLFVDPSTEARDRRSRMLVEAGLTVHEADNAEAAVAVAQTLRELHVLITEGVLGGQFTGFDLRDAVAQRFPSMRSVFTSRYDLTELAAVTSNEKVLYEPVDESALLQCVLDGHSVEAPAASAAATPASVEPSPQEAPLEPSVTAEADSPEEQPVAQAEEPPLAAPEPEAPVLPTLEAEEAPAPVEAESSPLVEAAPCRRAVQSVIPDTLPAHLQPGMTLGNYVIKERLYAERDTETYLALQGAVQREVALVLLKPELLSDLEAVERFRERSRLKASIAHPRIAPLYEAIETDGWVFYTREMPHGRSLDDLILAGVKYEEKELADIVAGVSEAMSQAQLRGYHYRMPTARDIFLDEAHEASVVNVFRPPSVRERDHAADTGRFLMMLRPLCHGPRARHLLDELLREHLDWEALRQKAMDLQAEYRQRSLLRRADTKEAHEIQAAAQAARQGQSSPRWGRVLVAVIVLGVAAFVWRIVHDGPHPSGPPVREQMVKVPEGEFIYQDGQKKTLPDFWIDKWEVTIGQYEEFLQAMDAEPKKVREYNHPDQPPNLKTHRPEQWAQTLGAAKSGGYIDNQRVDLNSPVSNVTWWDAFAYAKWRGRRLPTEQEWEKAARGTDGRHYPWGDKDQPGAANLGDDYDPVGKKGGKIDGYNYWEPVNRITKDISPSGAAGMAGNVEEWTGTWVPHPDDPDKLVPVVRGGDFATKSSDALLTNRYLSKSPDHHLPLRGFRTASDKAPEPAKQP